MIESINSKIDLDIKGISYLGLSSYGKILIGNKGFEFYNDKNITDFIQIPWSEVDYISASVLFKGKWITRFAIFTKKNGYFEFSTRNNKKTLKEISKYISKDKMFRSKTFIQIIFNGIVNLFKMIKK